ncbi:hypothetical protein [Rhodospirillaceae bacterium SYSU D60014]|uniref:hypothetical protein n=1 Tax=Virgifigura deserti TaxID=2268457 RepID=UPI000E66F231
MEAPILAEAVAAHGLMLRGGFHPDAGDGVPPLGDGRPAGTVILVGNAGPAMWRAFTEARITGPHPLDRWTRRILADIARAHGAMPLFPFDGPPYLPFQRWAMRAEPVASSPLGMLIHPDYGLWHAYRGALSFAERLALPPPDRRPSPCESCADRPCLGTCPVGAFTMTGMTVGTGTGYDTAACRGHIARPAGADCMGEGCRARRACPIGQAYRHAPDQAEFHMRAFLASRRRHTA